MNEVLSGQLQIDHERGVIWFNTDDPRALEKYGTLCILRICRLPAPLPKDEPLDIAWSDESGAISWKFDPNK